MSKSLGNYIGISEEPKEMYGKTMSIPDGLIINYFELVTDIHPDELEQIKAALNRGEINPRDIKMRLAREITSLYHGREAADLAQEHFKQVFQRHDIPSEIPVFTLPRDLCSEGGADLIKVLVLSGLIKSGSEARRLMIQGGVKINGIRTHAFRTGLQEGDVIQAGKLKFIKIKFS